MPPFGVKNILLPLVHMYLNTSEIYIFCLIFKIILNRFLDNWYPYQIVSYICTYTYICSFRITE